MLLLVALIVGGVAPAALAAEGPPGLGSPPASPGLAPPPAVVPPALQTLEQKMGALQITSLRFSERTHVTIPRLGHKLGPLTKLLKVLGDSGISGEVMISPPAGNVTLDFFGHPLTLRLVGKTTYLYLHALASGDHGRPWIKLGPGGLGELITVNGKPLRKSAKSTKPQTGAPALAEPPFAKLQETLAKATEIRELGARTVDGQPVTSFLAVLEPEALKGVLKSKALVSAAVPLPPGRPPRQPTTATLEVAFAESGLPVRTVITTHTGRTTVSGTLEIPAINFPLVIQAPPADQTIGLAQLKALERRLKAKKRRHHHPKNKP